MPKSKKPGDQRLREPLPSLDDEVDESTSREEDKSASREPGKTTARQDDTSTKDIIDNSTGRQDDLSTSRSEEPSTETAADDEPGPPEAANGEEGGAAPTRLQKQLELLMEGVELPAEPPRMTEKTNAHISSETDERLREAVRVLEMRYGKGFSKSLLVEYVLRGALWDLHENADNSQIVRVLDRVFDRG